MNQQPVVSLNTSGGVRFLNLTNLVVEHRHLLQLSRRKEEEAYFVDYIPPARDALTLPRNVVYVLVGVVLVIMATYAIVGHLIKDLVHDLAGNPLSGDHSHLCFQSGIHVYDIFEFHPVFFPFWVTMLLYDLPNSYLKTNLDANSMSINKLATEP